MVHLSACKSTNNWLMLSQPQCFTRQHKMQLQQIPGILRIGSGDWEWLHNPLVWYPACGNIQEWNSQQQCRKDTSLACSLKHIIKSTSQIKPQWLRSSIPYTIMLLLLLLLLYFLLLFPLFTIHFALDLYAFSIWLLPWRSLYFHDLHPCGLSALL